MSNSDDFGRVLGLTVGAVMLVITTALIIYGCNNRSWKEFAIESGHAEYVLKGSEAVWQWKECEHSRGSEKLSKCWKNTTKGDATDGIPKDTQAHKQNDVLRVP